MEQSRQTPVCNVINLTVNGVRTHGLVDSGASVTLLSERLCQRLKLSSRLLANDCTLLTADASDLTLMGKVTVELNIGGAHVDHICYVAKQLYHPCLIGMDLLEVMRAQIDVSRHTLTLLDGLVSVPLTSVGAQLVYNVANVTVPAWSETRFRASTRPTRPGTHVMIEPSWKARPNELLVAKALVDPVDGQLVCQVMNPTDRSIRLRRGDVVAQLTPVSLVAACTVDPSTPSVTSDSRTMAEKLAVLQQKGISLDTCAFQGVDRDQLVDLLVRNIDLFAQSLADLPGCDVLEFSLDLIDSKPFRNRNYRLSPEDQKECQRQIDEMHRAGIIKQGDSAYNNAYFLVDKGPSTRGYKGKIHRPTGQPSQGRRLVLDLRTLNRHLVTTSWPLPRFEEVVDAIAANRSRSKVIGQGQEHDTGQIQYFSSLDLFSGYYQLKLKEDTATCTAFTAPDGNIYYFNRAPMGCSVSPNFFQRLMRTIFCNIDPSVLLIYLDDALIIGHSPQDMLTKLELVFSRLRSAKLRMHPRKCFFGADKIKFLGHFFDKDGLSVDRSKVELISKFPRPICRRDIKSFLGVAGYYRRFVKGFSNISAPLRKLLAKDVPFEWTDDCEKAFETLKERLITAPTLRLPDSNRRYFLLTDASYTGISYVLCQKDDEGKLHPVSYGGRAITETEARWGVTQLELLAVVCGVREYNVYLQSPQGFTIITDHKAIQFLNTMPLHKTNGRLMRWAMELQEYRYDVIYRRGDTHTAADGISRMPFERLQRDPTIPEALNLDIAKHDITDGFEAEPLDTHVDVAQDRTHVVDPPVGPDAPRLSPECIATVDIALLPTREELQQAYASCPDFCDLVTYLSTRQLPQDDTTARKILLEEPDYVLEDGILYRFQSSNSGALHGMHTKVICVPTALRPQVTIGIHDRNAHAGIQRTYATARTRFYWPGMYAFIRDHVLSCLVCMRISTTQAPIPPINLPVPPVHGRWHIDWHGPIPKSADGYSYILVAIDSTSNWPELIAVKDVTAQTAVQAIYDNIICRYGVPEGLSFLTDNGSSFIAKFWRLFCDTFQAKHLLTTPFHQATNSRAELIAKVIHKSLKTLCHQQADWPQHLQSVALAYRASSTTNLQNLSPFQVCFARPMRLPIDWALLGSDTNVANLEAHVADLRVKLAVYNHVAEQAVADSAVRHAQPKRDRARDPRFQVGTKVLLEDPVVKKSESAKLKMRFAGPFVITECLPHFNYRIQRLSTGKTLTRPVHASRLRAVKQLVNDYRDASIFHKLVMWSDHVPARPTLQVELVLGTIPRLRSDALYIPMDLSITGLPGDEDADRFWKEVNRARQSRQHNVQGCTSIPLEGIASSHLIQCAGSQDGLEDIKSVLTFVDQSLDMFTLVVALPDVNDLWDYSQSLSDIIVALSGNVDGRLRRVTFVTLSLTLADVLSTVLRTVVGSNTRENETDFQTASKPCDPLVDPPNSTQISQQPNSTPQTEQTIDPKSNPVVDSQWFAIERILKRQLRKGKPWFLVKWQDYDETSWVPRADVTDAAIQEFYSRQPARTHKRR